MKGIEKLKNKVQKLTKGMKNMKNILNNKYQKLKELYRKRLASLKRKKVNINKFSDAQHFTNPISRAMVRLNFVKKVPFTNNKKDLAKRTFYYLASCYKHLRKGGLKIPHESTLRR